ncbi:MAG: protein phosphatase 2C domain-containing protein [Dehalococcoidia bacterium]
MSFLKSLFGKGKDEQPESAASGGRFATRTDPGKRHSHNEDCPVARELPDGSILLAVADGVGGLGGGEVASAAAIEAVVDELSAGDGDIDDRIRKAFSTANTRVREAAAARADLQRIACTLALAVVQGRSARIAHLGDSRIYLFHDGSLRQLTEDHSWVAEQVRAGTMTEEDAEQSQFRNVITRGVGVEETATLDAIQVVPLPSPSVLLVCSDGLSKAVAEEELYPALRLEDPELMAERLVEMANEAGGPDNIAVAVLLITD